MATAAICNIVLEFSSLKEIILQKGGIRRFAELSYSTTKSLRLNAVWALKNIVYDADPPVRGLHTSDLTKQHVIHSIPNLFSILLWLDPKQIKLEVMKELTYPRLAFLIRSDEEEIREIALSLLRNLAFSRRDEPHEQEVAAIFSGFGRAGLLEILQGRTPEFLPC
mmetsp:Transcript_4177/g.8081  ORF Transcript_4177/g.8081 Transcript_4177/m.8081 type:complete len:166 (-) Transcript_4177:1587-2084(-)